MWIRILSGIFFYCNFEMKTSRAYIYDYQYIDVDSGQDHRNKVHTCPVPCHKGYM